jgi:hypothetical protein
MVRQMIAMILLWLLTACTTSVIAPTSQLVEKAIALELQQTRQQLNQQLDLDFQGFEINRLSITQRKALTVEDLPTYRIQGNYNLTFKLPKRKLTQPQKLFDVYLQLQREGKTWRLLVPEDDSKDSKQVWRSYSI